MILGIVKWFDNEKGFGVVENPLEGEFFLHFKNFVSPPERVSKGAAIIFVSETDNKKDRKVAKKCKLVEGIDDWAHIMSFLDRPDNVKIEVEVSGRGKRGNLYHYKQMNDFSVKELATKQIFKEKSDEQITNILINYFENGLDEKLFIPYCKFIDEKIRKDFYRGRTQTILSNVYKYFGSNLTERILFETWKSKTFKFIGYTDNEYQIPENILKKFSSEIGAQELSRIKAFEFGQTFCSEFVYSQFAILKNLDSKKLKGLYQFLDYVNGDKRLLYKAELDSVFSEKYIAELIEHANRLDIIRNDDDLNKYSRLKIISNNQVGEELQKKVDFVINNIIINNSVEEFKPELWVKGLVDKAPFEFISKAFLSTEMRKEKRLTMLLKLNLDQKVELLKAFSEINDWEKSFSLISDLLRHDRSIEDIEGFIEIRNQVLDNFSFKNYNCTQRLSSFISSNSLTDESRKNLRENLDREKKEIETEILFNIFSELKDYRIIKDSNHLLELLVDKTVNYSEFGRLIYKLSDNAIIPLFRAIVLYNINQFSFWQKIKLLESAEQKLEIAKVLIDEYFPYEEGDATSTLSSLVEFLLNTNNIGLNSYFLDSLCEEAVPKYSILIFELAMLSNHVKAQKISYQYITFNTEDEIVDFIEKVKNYKLSDEVKAINKPLTGFIEFLTTPSNIRLSEECKKFLKFNTGIVQCLSIKYLVYQYYKKNITKEILFEIVNTYNWTEISALLVKTFIQESNYSEKFLLEKLNPVFKEHFEILRKQNFEAESFLNNFKIKNILNSCNGRKHYDAELWKRNGITRWYVRGGVSTNTKEVMNCYCEGRPWKKEALWDSRTNKPTDQIYEFYWCKTSYCAETNYSTDLNLPFNKWTISEISSALNITIEKIAIATLAGWVNRMNRITDHLFCRSCDEVLRPLPFRPTTLGYYAVPLFHCVNDKCTDKQTIRFTHCLNGKCESHKYSEPLDSRDCKSCKPGDPNHTGMECNYCGSSCPTCSGLGHRVMVGDLW